MAKMVTARFTTYEEQFSLATLPRLTLRNRGIDPDRPMLWWVDPIDRAKVIQGEAV